MAYLSSEALQAITQPVARELSGTGAVQITQMPGGASLRRYHRVTVAGGRPASFVIMELGETGGSEEASSGGRPAELPFLAIQRYLARGGVPVPTIFRHDQQHGLLFMEDLGDVTLESRVAGAPAEVQRRYYQVAIDQLVALQKYAVEHVDPGCIAFGRGFDLKLLLWELDHFREYGLEAQGFVPSAGERAELDRSFRAIAERLAAEPRLFTHRDYQSRNLMVDEPEAGSVRPLRLRVIDFQDALLGTSAYDLVGLLRDSYVELAPPLLDELVAYHAARAGRDPVAFRALFDLQTVQRKLKDAGRFVFIDRVKKNPSYLVHIPSSLRYVSAALARLPEWAPLSELLARWLPVFARGS